MKRRALLSAILLTGFFLLVAPLWAANDVGPAGQSVLNFLGQTAEKSGLTDNPDPAEAESPTSLISVIINTVLGLLGVVFFIQLFIAGIRWMMSEGNDEVIKNSKATIISASAGLLIAFSAFMITNFVLNRLDSLNPAPETAPASTAPPPEPSISDPDPQLVP